MRRSGVTNFSSEERQSPFFFFNCYVFLFRYFLIECARDIICLRACIYISRPIDSRETVRRENRNIPRGSRTITWYWNNFSMNSSTFEFVDIRAKDVFIFIQMMTYLFYLRSMNALTLFKAFNVSDCARFIRQCELFTQKFVRDLQFSARNSFVIFNLRFVAVLTHV